MTHWMLKRANTIVAVTLLLFFAGSSSAQHDTSAPQSSARDVLTRTQAAYTALSSYSDAVKIEARANGKPIFTWEAHVKLGRPNLYLVEYDRTTLGANEGHKHLAFWSVGDGVHETGEKGTTLDRKAMFLPYTPWDVTNTPYVFFNRTSSHLPLSPECCAGRNYELAGEEKVGDVDCYVLKGGQIVAGTATSTLWIGRKDYLLRQVRTEFSEGVATETHSNIVVNVPMSPADFTPSQAD